MNNGFEIKSDKSFIVHYILTIGILAIIGYHWNENPKGLSILAGLFLIPIFLNKRHIVRLESEQFTVVTKYGFFKHIRNINLNNIKSIEIHYEDSFNGQGGKDGPLLNLITGLRFYTPQYDLYLYPNQEERIKLRLNLKEYELKDLVSRIRHYLDNQKA